MPHVVDASVAVKWFSPEIHSDAAERLRRGYKLLAPDFILLELANVLVTKSRSVGADVESAQTMLDSVSEAVELTPLPPLLPKALLGAMQFGRSAYDSLYVALALRERCQFVTADRRLYSALQPQLQETMLWVEDIPITPDGD
jgi:predicted nucleic acid-binding protein